jgi:ABC-type proline/glycine betaine transport system permease subunit
MNTEANDVWGRIFSETTAKAIFIASVLYAIYISSVGWDSNLLLGHIFRQTQTAVTVKALLNGGPWLAYETPVLGPPWSIPFEFPLYQWVVALVAKTGWLHINQAGRFVSEMFFFSMLFPLYKILGSLQLSKKKRYIVLALTCISPLYLFWSRTFMIESTALALSTYYLWLAFLCRKMFETNRINWRVLFLLAVTGTLAALVKVTTFFSFLLGAVMIILIFAYREYRKEGLQRKNIQTLVLSLAVLGLVPFLAVSVWVGYSDSLKELNPLANGSLTSTALQKWNFGSIEQKLSLTTWRRFYQRTFVDLLGYSHLPIISAIMLLFCRKERRIIALVSIGLFSLPLMTFTNLHYVHNYYQYANGIFLIVAIGIIITELLGAPSYLIRFVGLLLFGMIVFFSVKYYMSHYWPQQNNSFDFSLIRSDVDAYSDPEDVFLVLGDNWSSAIPYYIDRRAALIMKPELYPEKMLALKKELQSYRVGGIIIRTEAKSLDPQVRKFINEFSRFFNVKPGFFKMAKWYSANLFIFYNAEKQKASKGKL